MISVTGLKTVTLLMLVLVFATEFMTPLGFAHGTLYTPVLILALFIGDRRWLLGVGVGSIGLVLAGVYLSQSAEVRPSVYWFNRLLSISLLIATWVLLDNLLNILKSRRETIEHLQAARKELEQKQVLLDIAGELGRLGGWSFDATTNTLDWSDEIFRIHQFPTGAEVPTVDDAIGLYPPDVQPVLRGHFERCLLDGVPFDFETDVFTETGNKVPVRVMARPLYHQGSIVGVQGAFQDLTDYKKLERSAEFRQRLFYDLTNTLPIIIWMADNNGHVDYVNQALADYTGIPVEAMDLPNGWIELLHPDDRDVTLSVWENAIKERQPYTTEFRIRRHDGYYGHFLVSAKPVHRQNEGSRWYGTATDMDDYRQLQEQLHQARRLESIGQLTGVLAHDFNNLLMVITGNVGLLKDMLADRPQAQALVDVVLQASDNGTRLTESLLAFARRQRLAPARLDVAGMVRALEPMLRNSVGRNIDFQFFIDSNVPAVVLDRSQLESAVLNLAINARDAMPQGGTLALRVYKTDEQVVFDLPDTGQYSKDWVILELTDTGHGIDESAITRVYEPFFSTKPPGQGTGLGLSQVFGFVTQSGGEVILQSTPGAGTQVRLCFPASLDAP